MKNLWKTTRSGSIIIAQLAERGVGIRYGNEHTRLYWNTKGSNPFDCFGTGGSADIFKHLKEDEIEELTLEIANTRSVSPQVKEDVLNEFYQICLAQQYIAEGGIGYAKELLDKALGEDRAKEVITKLTASLQVRPLNLFEKQIQASY